MPWLRSAFGLLALGLCACLIPNPAYRSSEGLSTGPADDGGETTAVVETPEGDTTGQEPPIPDGPAEVSSGSTSAIPVETTGAEDECVPSAELCDGADNDCDGNIDEWSDDNESCGDCELLGWNGHGYAICMGDSTWFMAKADCEARGAQLVVIEDMAEDEFLLGTLEAWPNEFMWIGLDELEQEDEWVWVDGALATFLNFAAGEPNDDGADQDCAVIRSSTRGWHDLHCNNDSPSSEVTGWICEHVEP